MTRRLILCAAILAVVSGAAAAQPADPLLEPGLSSRMASFALLKLPPAARQSIAPVEWQVVERLQTLPLIQPTDYSEQLGLIFGQVRDNVASPELLASAARAVVGLLLPAGEESDAWTGFRTGVALRSQIAEVRPGAVASLDDPAAFAAGVKKAGETLKAEVARASQSGDPSVLGELRGRAVSEATRSIAAVWTRMLELQAPAANNSASAAKTPTGGAESASPAPEAPALDEAVTEPSAPVSYVGNIESKKFHKAGCRFGPGAKNSVPLASREEAIRQGYIPCKVCKP